jgi:hypothetical protein
VLVAHHDSVPASPGYSDDGLGLATVLETARLLASSSDRRCDVVILFTDGEEAGSWGARAFLEEHPLGASIGFVLNVDARGTAGPSLLFETSGDAATPLALASAAGARPITSSLFSIVYERLPNGTDFTVFRDRGLLGLNFASVSAPWNYHSTRDDAASFSNASLQDHGNAVSLVARRFVDSGTTVTPGKRVFFSVLRLGIVGWPAGVSVWLALLAALGVVGATWRSRADVRMARIALASFVPVVAALGAFGVGLVIMRVAVGQAVAPSTLGVFVAFGVASAIAAAKVASRWCVPLELSLGAGCAFATLAVASSVLAAGTSYLFVVPALATSAVALLAAMRPGLRDAWWPALLPIASCALVWLPLPPLFFDALGPEMLALCAALSAIAAQPVASTFVVPFTRPAVAGAALMLGALTVIASRGTVGYPLEETASCGLEQDAERGDASVIVYANPGTARAMAGTGPLTPERIAVAPWRPSKKGFAKSVPRVDSAGPTFTMLDVKEGPTGRVVRARITTSPGARLFRLLSRGDAIQSARWEGGKESTPTAEGDGYWREVSYAGAGAGGVVVELALAPGSMPELVLEEESTDLPIVLADVARARPAGVRAVQSGDVFRVHRSVSLKSP